MRLRKDGIDSMARVKAARDIFAAPPEDLNEKPDGGALGTEDGLHSRAPLLADPCRLNDTAVLINYHRRDDTAVGEEHTIEHTIHVH
jgi:hypothetical protein